MTTTRSRNAGIAYDLRHAWDETSVLAGRGADAAGEEESPPDDASPPPAVPASDTEEGDSPADTEIDNPEIKKLHDEAARHRNAAKAERERADTAEAQLASAHEAGRLVRVENAFLRACFGRVNDTDAAWKLADHTKLAVDDNGAIAGADEAVDDVLDRYPYLRPDDAEDEWSRGIPLTEPSGRPTNGRRKSVREPTRAVLEKKFPALRRRAR